MFPTKAVEPTGRLRPGKSASQPAWLIAATVALLIIFDLPLGNLIPGNGLGARVAQEGVFWAITLILLLYVLRVERRPISSIGLERPTWKSGVFGLIGALVVSSGGALIYLVVLPALGLPMNEAGFQAVQSMPLWFQVLVLVRAAVFEEIYYRGFVIERLTEITGRRWLAASISLMAFTFAHLSYWGWGSLVIVAFAAAVLTGLYLWRRDLTTTMIAHFLTDAFAFFLG